MTKPRLIPVKVPWHIELAISGFELIVRENQETFLLCNAMLLPKTYSQPFRFIDKAQVRLSFLFAAYTRTCPPQTDRNTIDVSKYDWSSIYTNEELGLLDEEHQISDVDLWQRIVEKRYQKWVDEQICTQSGMYIVQDSRWIADTGITKFGDYKHYLIVGHDIYVEIIAQDWEWNLVTTPDVQES